MKIKPKTVLWALNKNHVLRISKSPIESVILVFINIHYSYRIWVPALMLIRLFQFCNPFLSYICEYRPWASFCYSASLRFDFNKSTISPWSLCMKEAERGLQAWIPCNWLGLDAEGMPSFMYCPVGTWGFSAWRWKKDWGRSKGTWVSLSSCPLLLLSVPH